MPAHDHCCVPNCSNRRDKCPGLSFHGLPANEGLRKRWSRTGVAWSRTVQTRPAPRVRHLQILPFEAKVSTCATEVDTLKAELA